MRHFLVFVQGSVEPYIQGEYDSDEARLEAARNLERDHDEDGLFRLDIDEQGNPTIEAFFNYEMEDFE